MAKITREIPWTRPLITLTSYTGGAGDAPSGQVPTSIGSNGQVAWGSNVGTVSVNGALVLGPYVNFANGSNTLITVDQVGSFASNTIRIHASSSVSALDDLSDVVITSPGSGQRLRFNGTNWINVYTRFEPHVDYTGSVVIDGSGNPVMVEVLS